MRPVSRVDWQDLTSLIEGEAIVLFSGRRIYARVFHAIIDDSGPKRLGRCLMLREPDAAEVRERVRRADEVAERIATGTLGLEDEGDVSPVLGALVEGFVRAAEAGMAPAECVTAALRTIAQLPDDRLPPRPPPPADGTPVTAVSPMLVAASGGPVSGPQTDMPPEPPIDASLLRRLIDIEATLGVPPAVARGAAIGALSERDLALAASAVVEPPPMPPQAFANLLRSVLTQLRDLRDPSVQRHAA